jgi:peptidoglycan-N-acetylmuramic acid deacetylase
VRKIITIITVFIMLNIGLAACAENPISPDRLIGTPQAQIVPELAPTPTVPPTPTATATATPTLAPLPTVTSSQPSATPVIAGTATPARAPDIFLPTVTRIPATATPTRTPRPTVTFTPASTPTPRVTQGATPTLPATPTPTVTPTPTPLPTELLTEVFRGKTGRKQVGLTLDAGAGADPFPKMIKALTEADVKITFFLTGTWAQQNPTFVEQIVAGGHEIANHSWSHPDHTTISNEQIEQETAKTEELLSKMTGQSIRPLWRAPYGSRNDRVLATMKRLGYRNIMWTLDSLDSVGQPKSAQFLIDRITKQSDAALDGEIILMHIGNPTTADALPAILRNLKERGFEVVTITELLR